MAKRRHTANRARVRAGFTLVELMVALAIGGVALSAIYAVGSASTRHFREQMRVSNTQTALRMALDQIKRDFARAGYLATPNATTPGESCSPPVGNPVSAVVGYVDNDTAPTVTLSSVADTSGEVTFDSVMLMGNYSTSGEYAVSAASTVSDLRLAPDWQSFRRDFFNWDPDANAFLASRFTDAFVPGRMARVHTADDRMHFAVIASSTATDPPGDSSVVLATAASCNPIGGWISPLNTIAYRAEAAAAADLERLATTAEYDINGPIAILRRVELDGATRTAPLLDPTSNVVDSRSILDYVVGFNLSFRMAAAGTAGVPNTTLNWPPTNNAVTIAANPERLRSVIVNLAVRTPEQDPGMWPVAGAPLRAFAVFEPIGGTTGRPGAARVRTARAEIFLPNIAYRRL